MGEHRLMRPFQTTKAERERPSQVPSLQLWQAARAGFAFQSPCGLGQVEHPSPLRVSSGSAYPWEGSGLLGLSWEQKSCGLVLLPELSNRAGQLQVLRGEGREECFRAERPPAPSRGRPPGKGKGTRRTSGLDAEVDLAFGGVRDAVAAELHVRAAGEKGAVRARPGEARGSGHPRPAGAQEGSGMTEGLTGGMC